MFAANVVRLYYYPMADVISRVDAIRLKLYWLLESRVPPIYEVSFVRPLTLAAFSCALGVAPPVTGRHEQ